MKTRLVTAAPALPPIPAGAAAESHSVATANTPLSEKFKHSRSDYGLRHPPPQVLPFRPANVPLAPPPDLTSLAQITPSSTSTTPHQAPGNGHSSAKQSRHSPGMEGKGEDDHPLETCVIAPRIPPPPSSSATSGSTR